MREEEEGICSGTSFERRGDVYFRRDGSFFLLLLRGAFFGGLMNWLWGVFEGVGKGDGGAGRTVVMQ